MKRTYAVLFILLSASLLSACQTGFGSSDDVESWELRPFYGESRFLLVDAASGEPIPKASLTVEHLSITELQEKDSVPSDQDGVITIHQLERGIVYWGDGPPPPTFTFSAPNYASQTLSIDDLVAATSYDPYDSTALPTTTFVRNTQEIELPLYEFTIQLTPTN